MENSKIENEFTLQLTDDPSVLIEENINKHFKRNQLLYNTRNNFTMRHLIKQKKGFEKKLKENAKSKGNYDFSKKSIYQDQNEIFRIKRSKGVILQLREVSDKFEGELNKQKKLIENLMVDFKIQFDINEENISLESNESLGNL